MEILFPLEFVVDGTAVSLQAKRRDSIEQWKSRVRAASQVALPENHFATELPLAVTLYYFPAADMVGDIDNIVKPILDALNRYVYLSDRQIQRISVQKFEPGNVFRFDAPSPILQDAINRAKPVLYVRISDDPFEDLT